MTLTCLSIREHDLINKYIVIGKAMYNNEDYRFLLLWTSTLIFHINMSLVINLCCAKSQLYQFAKPHCSQTANAQTGLAISQYLLIFDFRTKHKLITTVSEFSGGYIVSLKFATLQMRVYRFLNLKVDALRIL